MDIYQTLKEHGEELIKEDLDFFEIELATGNYSKEYVDKCRSLITELKIWKKSKTQIIKDEKGDGYSKIEKKADPAELTEEEREILLKKKIDNCRLSSNYLERFTKLIYEFKIDEQFVDNNFVFFKPFELNELLKHIKFSEQFLDKYFKLLDEDVLAEYQLFSEEFFMKHFSKMDYKIVLKKSKNPWINNRSSKLNVFLKLKGVSI